jgi:hypothetical protein
MEGGKNDKTERERERDGEKVTGNVYFLMWKEGE